MGSFGKGSSLGLVRFSGKKPIPITTCDYSGHVCRMEDTIIQMEYRGSGLVSTGLRVHKKFKDEPNPQGKVPPFKVDPQVVTGTTPDTQTFDQGLVKTYRLDTPGGLINIYDQLLAELGTQERVTNYLEDLGTVIIEGATAPVILQWPEMFFDLIVKNGTEEEIFFVDSVSIVPDDLVKLLPNSIAAVSFNMSNRWSISYIGALNGR